MKRDLRPDLAKELHRIVNLQGLRKGQFSEEELTHLTCEGKTLRSTYDLDEELKEKREVLHEKRL